MRSKYIAWLLGIGIMLSVISIGVVARKSMSIYDQEGIPVISHNIIHNNMLDGTGGIKDGIIRSMQLSENSYSQLIKETYNLGSYLIYLQEYIRASETNLSAENEFKKDHMLQELMIIGNLEKKNNIQYMSIDGREIAISLLKNIYSVYGVNIEFGLDGDIKKVDDSLGNIIYQNPDKTLEIEFQIIHLTIVICLILILFALSVFITRKSKTLVKNGDIYGHDEKKYA